MPKVCCPTEKYNRRYPGGAGLIFSKCLPSAGEERVAKRLARKMVLKVWLATRFGEGPEYFNVNLYLLDPKCIEEQLCNSLSYVVCIVHLYV